MNSDFPHAARRLLTGDAGDAQSVPALAERAVAACDLFARHLAQLLGETGVELLFKRSVIRASAQFPWLATTSARTSTAVRAAMEQQPAPAVIDAFVALLTALVGLLERLIGEGLVERLLDEVWPSVFAGPAKDTP